jgi:hypothetical protein
MNPSTVFSNPTAPSIYKGDNGTTYPELLSESTNFRIKKIMDDEKLLQDEIKFRNSMCKKYGRFIALTDGVEYVLIMVDIVVGTLAATIPGIGSIISSAAFSGVGVVAGLAKVIHKKLNTKKLKHYKLSVVSQTTLNNLHHKISKSIIDGQITHEEFEDIQNTISEWKRGSTPVQHQTLNAETIELLSQQATEKAQKDLLDQLKHIKTKK